MNRVDVDTAPPLVADLDGTLIRSDTLLECFWKGMGVAPVRTVATALRLFRRRAALKHALAEIARPEPGTIPLDEDVIALLASARQQGRKVHLVSGATRGLVEEIAGLYGPFDGIDGSDRDGNLTAHRKAARLTERFGHRGFDYVGDSVADIPVWQAARKGFVARPRPAFLRLLKLKGLEPAPVGAPWRTRDLLRALRPHQWLKNMLLFLPLIAAHRTDAAGISAVVLGIVAFSALASSIYIVNDLIDLDADRLHESKRNRPFASGRVPIKIGMAASLGLGLLGMALGAVLGGWMMLVLLVYLVSTLSYSMHLKRVRWVDVTMLAGLYTLRVVAGAVAGGVAASGWLFGFIFPVFLSLGCVKRLTELSRARGDGFLPGRRYQPRDRDDLLNVSIISGIASVTVFVAYSLSDTAASLYDPVRALWAVALLLSVWLVRMIWTGWKGQQDYDPIIFAITDRQGVVLVALSAALLLYSGT
ncbi:UbiA family prenyltransferase [Rhodobacteraceae bacterium 2CG4]|uniref:UbiA family prenyltransferase n=1 Tax=Halovulum marinum TaxID=2662447 RepID=A0A6L5YXI4_9RHOB|nr:UbiA family prenyltransferase [Halovulum marinum]MSU88384.1 UbiA family prenyltransferase [Halovulum marinum]